MFCTFIISYSWETFKVWFDSEVHWSWIDIGYWLTLVIGICYFIIIIISSHRNLMLLFAEHSYCVYWALWLVSIVVLTLFWGRGRLRNWLVCAYIASVRRHSLLALFSVDSCWRTHDSLISMATSDVAPWLRSALLLMPLASCYLPLDTNCYSITCCLSNIILSSIFFLLRTFLIFFTKSSWTVP